MSSPGPNRQQLEDLWRKRLTDAKLRLDFAQAYVAEVRHDFPPADIPAQDGNFAHRKALKAENLARHEYARVLQLYKKLMVEGVIPNGIGSAEGRERLGRLLNAAIAETRADMGNIQLFDSSANSLRIVAQLGFDSRFLDYFDSVHEGQAACGTALTSGSQVVVEDVTTSPIFLGTPSLEVMLDARARAVQSTPIIGSAGLCGVLSTHYQRPVHPSENDLYLLERFAKRAAHFIER